MTISLVRKSRFLNSSGSGPDRVGAALLQTFRIAPVNASGLHPTRTRTNAGLVELFVQSDTSSYGTHAGEDGPYASPSSAKKRPEVGSFAERFSPDGGRVRPWTATA